LNQALIARRYALAAIGYAEEQSELHIFEDGLLFVQQTLKQSEQLRDFCKSQMVSADEQVSVMQSVFGNALADPVMRFLRFLVTKRRLNLLTQITEQFEELRMDRAGEAKAKITVAAELSAAEKKRVESALSQKVQKIIKPVYIVDPDILGGFIATVQDMVFDGSLRRQLSLLGKKLQQSTSL